MTTKSQHMPGLYRMLQHGKFVTVLNSTTRENLFTFTVGDITPSNAAFIVTACNAHEELLEACSLAGPIIDSFLNGQGVVSVDEMDTALMAIRDALTKIEGKV